MGNKKNRWWKSCWATKNKYEKIKEPPLQAVVAELVRTMKTMSEQLAAVETALKEMADPPYPRLREPKFVPPNYGYVVMSRGRPPAAPSSPLHVEVEVHVECHAALKAS
ncbi:uncharacterized protein LOC123879986 [Maniola jurtina]|uniref:uncharacterized protein LOC123879986 n=1 Tax=Maniola jurtina TaxID=191418 RepID=UPI001E6878F5|nr:uncharacterized protein LOC123879986 [Maniola jurtina]